MEVLMHRLEFQPMYVSLKKDPKSDKATWNKLQTIIADLKKSNQPIGIHHKLKTVPKEYRKKYDLQSLYHFEMPHDNRLMYTVRRGPYGGKQAVLLHLLDHDTYNKVLHYFKKKSH